MSGKQAMDKAGIKLVTYEARDGLATINGSNLVAGMDVCRFLMPRCF
jgi:histidine ammonia-lyase